MGDLTISQLLSGSTPRDDNPVRIRQAAQEFEGLMIEQLLRASRESGGGWLGWGGEDASSNCATEYAEQHVAMLLAREGGLGLAQLIGQGLAAKAAEGKTPAGEAPKSTSGAAP